MTRHRVEPGQPISQAFSAAGWNRAQDAADRVMGVRTGAEAHASRVGVGGSTVVTVRNNTGNNLPIYSIVAISGFENSTALFLQQEAVFGSAPILTGGIPTGGPNVAILLAPLEAGAYGSAAVAGSFPVRVQVRSAGHKFLTSFSGDTLTMKTSTCGYIRLLATSGFPTQGEWKWAMGAF